MVEMGRQSRFAGCPVSASLALRIALVVTSVF